MNWVTILGLVAGILTTISFLPQVIKTIKTKSTKDISLGMYSVLVAGTILWILYGVLFKSTPLIIANSVTLLLSFIILVYKIKYR